MGSYSSPKTTFSSVYQKVIKFSLISGAVSALVGCAVQLPSPKLPDEWQMGPGFLKNQLSLSAKGYQQFKCTLDEQGYYWQYIKTEADLYDNLHAIAAMVVKVPPVARLVANSGTNQTFTHADGSSVRTTQVIRNTPAPNKNKDLSSLMMKARPASKGEKAFDAVTLVSRTNAHGGMPSMTCGAQNLGKSHRFEFTATYTFWK